MHLRIAKELFLHIHGNKISVFDRLYNQSVNKYYCRFRTAGEMWDLLDPDALCPFGGRQQ